MKVWMHRALSGKWILWIGDMPEDIVFPAHFDEFTAKRAAIGRVIGRMREDIKRLERFRS